MKEEEKPVPQDDEILIKIHATVVTRVDIEIRGLSGLDGHRKSKKPRILGRYLAGDIEAIGKDVKRFKIGDQVLGVSKLVGGTYAEYKCLPEKGVVFLMPANLTYDEAVAVPSGAMTALPFLTVKGKIRSGQKVLVYGASGAIGTAAVQLARCYGAEVTGVCSAANLELVRSLGATKVIDYTKEDFTQNGEIYDIIYDTVGKTTFSRCKGSLVRGGVYLTVLPKREDLVSLIWTFIDRRKKARLMATALRSKRKKRKDLALIKKFAEESKLKAVIDRRYPLEQIVEAHRYVEQGHKKGNVVITVVDHGHAGQIADQS
ncbi:MAG: NAD(P)-dependent alcohol dehydrogenase [Methanomassiliicoccales archaeon]|nr:NAD(P)-dependent alcohol dehydrogenase [Methanomassiliicoccales archaeon]